MIQFVRSPELRDDSTRKLSLLAFALLAASCGSASEGPSSPSTSSTATSSTPVTTKVERATSTPTSTVSSAPAPLSSTTAASSLPKLGISGVYFGGSGFGSIEPAKIYLGGDPTGLVTGISWSSWGGATASGVGTGSYVAPNEVVAQAKLAPVKIVAFDLGTCNGVYAYQKVEWYFAGEGESFNAKNAITTCLFFGQPPS